MFLLDAADAVSHSHFKVIFDSFFCVNSSLCIYGGLFLVIRAFRLTCDCQKPNIK